MDVTRILEADHREVEGLFVKIDAVEGAQRAPLIDEVASSLKAHMDLEEAVVYPAIKPVTGEEPVQEGATEHDLVRRSLEEMLALAPDEPGFGAAFEAVKAEVAHHVEEEENDVFPMVRSNGAEVLDNVATPFMTKRLELGLPVTADALAAAATKEELSQEAKTAGIDGFGSMSKDDLAEALAANMT
jgi:hemerythrin-like domain-containing protein